MENQEREHAPTNRKMRKKNDDDTQTKIINQPMAIYSHPKQTNGGNRSLTWFFFHEKRFYK